MPKETEGTKTAMEAGKEAGAKQQEEDDSVWIVSGAIEQDAYVSNVITEQTQGGIVIAHALKQEIHDEFLTAVRTVTTRGWRWAVASGNAC